MSKNKVTVYVGGRRLMLVSSDDEKYIKNIAQKVNERIDAVAKAYPQLDARGCAIMTALDYADDEKKALGKKAELVDQANKVLRKADKQSKQIIELKKQNSELDKKYDELLEKFEDLRKKNSNLTAQYNELKKFLDKQINISAKNKKDSEKEFDDLNEEVSGKSQGNSNNTEKTAEKTAEKTSEKNEDNKNNKKPVAYGNKENGNKKNPQNKSQNKSQYVFGKNSSNNFNKKVNEDIIKPETAADVMKKGYIPLRQYSLFDEDNK